jgi:hydrogenase maturation protease
MRGIGNRTIVVLGVGTARRGDDGFGAAVLAELGDLPALDAGTRLAEFADDPVHMTELWEGVDHAIILSTARGGAERCGYIRRSDIESGAERNFPADFEPSGRGRGVGPTPRRAAALGRLPGRITLYTVQGRHFAPNSPLSRPVAAAVTALATRIRREILAARSPRPAWALRHGAGLALTGTGDPDRLARTAGSHK